MHSRTKVSLTACIALAGVFPLGTGAQETSIQAQIEDGYKASLAAFAAGDIEAITGDVGSAVGFGFRTLAPRGVDDPRAVFSREGLRRFFDSLEYYNVELQEMNTAVYDDVVVAWGFHTEEFQHRGREPESYRVRFSFTVMRGQDGELRTVMSHRDIQPFGDQGRYVPRH